MCLFEGKLADKQLLYTNKNKYAILTEDVGIR